jgi:hypothetical protein
MGLGEEKLGGLSACHWVFPPAIFSHSSFSQLTCFQFGLEDLILIFWLIFGRIIYKDIDPNG